MFDFRGFLNRFPYTDFHELNLDFLLEGVGKLKNGFEELTGRVSRIEETIESGYDLPDNVVTGDNQNMFRLLDVSKLLNAPAGYSGYTFQGGCADGFYAYYAGYPEGGTTHLLKRTIESGNVIKDVDTGYFIHANNITMYGGQLYVTVNTSDSDNITANQVLVYDTSLNYVGKLTIGGSDGNGLFCFGISDHTGETLAVAGISGTNDYYIMPEIETGKYVLSAKTLISEYYTNTRQGADFGTFIYQLRSGASRRNGAIDVYTMDGRRVTSFYLQGQDESAIEYEDLTKVGDVFYIIDSDGALYQTENVAGWLTSHSDIAAFNVKSSAAQLPTVAFRTEARAFDVLDATYETESGYSIMTGFQMPPSVNDQYKYLVNGTMRFGNSYVMPLVQNGSLGTLKTSGVLRTTSEGHMLIPDIVYSIDNTGAASLTYCRLLDVNQDGVTFYNGWDEVAPILGVNVYIGTLAYENMGNQRSGYIAQIE